MACIGVPFGEHQRGSSPPYKKSIHQGTSGAANLQPLRDSQSRVGFVRPALLGAGP